MSGVRVSSVIGSPPSKETDTVPFCGSCRQLESYTRIAVPAATPSRLNAGVESEALNLASAKSSYSSESPTAITPVPLVNSARS